MPLKIFRKTLFHFIGTISYWLKISKNFKNSNLCISTCNSALKTGIEFDSNHLIVPFLHTHIKIYRLNILEKYFDFGNFKFGSVRFTRNLKNFTGYWSRNRVGKGLSDLDIQVLFNWSRILYTVNFTLITGVFHPCVDLLSHKQVWRMQVFLVKIQFFALGTYLGTFEAKVSTEKRGWKHQFRWSYRTQIIYQIQKRLYSQNKNGTYE